MWHGVLCGLLAGAMWGLVFVAPAYLTAFTPLELACGRYIAYGLISAGLLFNRLPALLRRLDRADMVALVKHALAGNIVYYMLLAMGVKLAGVAATSLILSAYCRSASPCWARTITARCRCASWPCRCCWWRQA